MGTLPAPFERSVHVLARHRPSTHPHPRLFCPLQGLPIDPVCTPALVSQWIASFGRLSPEGQRQTQDSAAQRRRHWQARVSEVSGLP